MIRAVVVGRARGALEDYAAARALCDFDLVLAVNAAGVYLPDPVDHWVTFHADNLDAWVAARAAARFPPAACYWVAKHRGRQIGVTTARPLRWIENSGGSSGLLAAEVARVRLGADRVVLAGVPMEAARGHMDGAPGGEWEEADFYWEAWLRHADELRGVVRSMSGRTRELLGEPTREWLG